MVKHNARDLLRHCDFVVTQPIDDLCMVTLYDPKVKAEQTALVKCLVDNLSEEEKILVSLYAIYGETAAETAQDMHKSKSAVYKGWERIRKKAQIIADRLHVDAREYL